MGPSVYTILDAGDQSLRAFSSGWEEKKSKNAHNCELAKREERPARKQPFLDTSGHRGVTGQGGPCLTCTMNLRGGLDSWASGNPGGTFQLYEAVVDTGVPEQGTVRLLASK